MSGKKGQRRNAVGLIASVVMHLLVLGLIINQQPPVYDLLASSAVPEPVTPSSEPAMDVRIMKLTAPPKIEPAPTPRPAPVPSPTPPTPAKPAPPQPQPTPEPQPVVPTRPKILPPTPTPPAPTPIQQAPSPPKPAPVPTPTPAPTPAPPKPEPTPRPAPTPTVSEVKAPPAPSTTPAKPAAALKSAAPTALNIHEAAQPTPAGVPTLPLAPSAGAAGRPAGSTSATQNGAPAGSRLNGLISTPYGFMPNGGGGLRGTLVGCANAEAVRLSGAERDKCNERFGVDIAGAPRIDSMSAGKRAAFDKAAEKDAAWAKYRASGLSPAGPSEPGGIDHGPASSEVLDHPASDYPPK